MLRRLERPTSLKPSTSVQNLCDSSMSRTLITRWLMPAGVRACTGAAGPIFEVPSAIVTLRNNLSASAVEIYGAGAKFARAAGGALGGGGGPRGGPHAPRG